jgi:two-component system, chemotaxis family, protein-glutamate methylesterase/glutaminase
MVTRDIIVVAASAGGVDALKQVVQGLPKNLPAAVFVVLHLPAHGPSVLPKILSRAGALPAVHPQDRDEIRPGMIYVAPPDYHLLVKAGHVRITRGPRENSHRPAADALFRTAARAYGSRVIGVVLSGVLDDGTAGLLAIKRMGGMAVAQAPSDALYTGMPQSAIDHVAVDCCLPAAQMPELLVRLTTTPVPAENPGHNQPPADLNQEADMAELEPTAVHADRKPGDPSVFACPECGGTLWEMHDHDLVRYRCRVGHAYSAESLLAEKSESLEAAMWTALRALEEQAALSRRMIERAVTQGRTSSANSYRGKVAEAESHAELIRRVLLTRHPDPSTQTFDAGGTAGGSPRGESNELPA